MTENGVRFIACLSLYAARYNGMISDDHYITELIKLYNSNEKKPCNQTLTCILMKISKVHENIDYRAFSWLKPLLYG